MPRVPAGLHRQTGSGQPGAFRPQRYTAASQRQYWRRTASVLHAAANSILVLGTPAGPVGAAAAIPALAFAGPQGAGEQWDVDVVQVQLGGQFGQPPLVTQQVVAQALGTQAKQPPPVIAQAWLQVGGVNVYLLAQTSNGGNDALTVSCPLLSQGEGIAVVWYGWAPGTLPWMTLRGTRYTLGPG